MFPRRPRLRTFDYIGAHRYLLTSCTAGRRPWFGKASTVDEVLWQLRRSAARFEIALIAWCFMPDHLHVLAAGASERAECSRFVKDFKQRSGYVFKQRTGEVLWQPSFHDRVLRDEEATVDVAHCVLANPVRAGLVTHPRDYPFVGSEIYTVDDLWQA